MEPIDVVSILDTATGGSFNMDMLRGPRTVKTRQIAMEAITGDRMPICKCGIRALIDALVEELCIDTHGMCSRSVELAISDELRKVKELSC